MRNVRLREKRDATIVVQKVIFHIGRSCCARDKRDGRFKGFLSSFRGTRPFYYFRRLFFALFLGKKIPSDHRRHPPSNNPFLPSHSLSSIRGLDFAAFEKSELKRSNVDFWYGMKESLFVEETWREGSWGRTKEDSMAWKKTGREKKSKDKHKIGFRWRGKIPSCNRVRE